MGIRKNGFPAKAVEYVATLEAGARVTSEQLADAIGYTGPSLPQVLKAARECGEIACERDINGYVWFLPEVESDEPEKFNAALWLDGDLILRGVQVNEDDSVTITADQLAKLKRLIAWSPAP
jgi:hypothetical protein